MWKWTDADKIKVIILDVDSLAEEYLKFPYKQYINDVYIVLAKKINFDTDYDEDFKMYYDCISLLQETLVETRCESMSVISISNDPIFLKEMMQNHIGTILTCHLKKEFLKYTPDFTDCTIEQLPMILQKERKGYGAEVYATYNESRAIMSLLKCKSKILLANKDSKTVDCYFGGRYYSDKHEYLFNDPLSFDVLRFKYQYVKAVDLFFDSAINLIRNKESIDILTFIPLKPKDLESKRFDRFKSLHLERNTKEGFRLQNILKCKKDFSQKGNDLPKRKETVIGAFEVKGDIFGKNIIIIDDVYSTGSTMMEAIKTLYEKGANKVIAITLAVNQMTESYLKYQNLSCPYCEKPMILRANNQTGKLFFGCKEYKLHQNKSYTLDIETGLYFLKSENKLIVSDIIDLEDKY